MCRPADTAEVSVWTDLVLVVGCVLRVWNKTLFFRLFFPGTLQQVLRLPGTSLWSLSFKAAVICLCCSRGLCRQNPGPKCLTWECGSWVRGGGYIMRHKAAVSVHNLHPTPRSFSEFLICRIALQPRGGTLVICALVLPSTGSWFSQPSCLKLLPTNCQECQWAQPVWTRPPGCRPVYKVCEIPKVCAPIPTFILLTKASQVHVVHLLLSETANPSDLPLSPPNIQISLNKPLHHP